jgi:hypothetical protein
LAESDFVALNFEDQFFPGTGPTNATSTIGPSITITGQTIDIPISLYDKLKAEGRGVYIWGWMEYDDVYAPSTPRRRTEFCVYLGWEGNPKVRGAGEPKAYFYRSFNGSDSDCYRQPAV